MNTKSHIIITGVTSGLGLSLASHLLEGGHSVYGINRRKAPINGALRSNYKELIVDLRQLTSNEIMAEEFFRVVAVDTAEATSVALILNAFTEMPVANIGKLKIEDVISSASTNFMSSVMLMNIFVNTFQTLASQKCIVAISSGAAKNPFPGGSIYCSTKAALDSLIRCLTKEQVSFEHPIKGLIVYPGIIDTEMQGRLRKQNFASQLTFSQFFEKKLLLDPDTCASQIINEVFQKPNESSDEIQIRY